MRFIKAGSISIEIAALAFIGLSLGSPASAHAADLPPNAAEGVQYVGTETCAECHTDQHESFLDTLHSRAARPTDFRNEPQPIRFRHEASGHDYEVDVVAGKMVHREHINDPSGVPLASTEEQMVTTLGSGTNAKSYLCLKGDFHIQSPITYFEDVKKWAMSPGYDVPVNRSFRRTVTVTCVFCHVGMVEQQKQNPYKFSISEFQIGCERCHGPGELHVKRHRENPNWVGADDSIVNPESLPRDLAEAVCHQCHTQGVQAINVSGKNDWDFRPGQKMTDVRVDFQFRRGDNSMRLVGHVEQMHASKCYTESQTLTCVTCHDPHAPPDHGNRVEYFRNQCYECHDDGECGEPHEKRLSENNNHCSECHMPRGETNVSHFALHNHRIGIHRDQPNRATDDAASFLPILDIAYLPDAEQKRLSALAKYEIYRRHGANPNFVDFNVQATQELIALYQAGGADTDVGAAMAWLARDQGQQAIAKNIAVALRNTETNESMPRIVATNVLASILFDEQDFEGAVQLYRELDGLHRDGRDTYFLGLAEANTKNLDKAIEALNRAVAIEPSQVAAHAALAAIYTAQGKADLAQAHQQAVQRNQILQQAYARGREEMVEQASENAGDVP